MTLLREQGRTPAPVRPPPVAQAYTLNPRTTRTGADPYLKAIAVREYRNRPGRGGSD